MKSRILLWAMVWSWLAIALTSQGATNFTLEIRDETTGEIIPARVHLADQTGKPVRADGLPFWRDHFVCDGTVQLELPPGDYTCVVERGPEFTTSHTGFSVGDSSEVGAKVNLRRITHLAQEGWWPGETHVHRPPREAELLMRAEDLHVAQFITWWNGANPWSSNAPPAQVVTRFDQNRFYHVMAGEDERDGGALLYHDLVKPLNITNGTRHVPSSLVFARQARALGSTWIEAEKPFWWDFPLWVAHGMADTVGLANNHLHRGGVLDNEAWGRPRDLAKYPGPRGNGLWTQDIYYHLLNCGLRLPPTAGSASGVLPNPVGYNRVYVQMEGEFTYEKWRDGLRAGRSFVSNGPLLRGQANGQFPGHVFQTNGPLSIDLDLRLDSRDPIARVELVYNGRITPLTLPDQITLNESGWFLVRAITRATNTLRFASTAPWYVELNGAKPRPIQRASAQFFVDWCAERLATLEKLTEVNASQKAALLQPWREAAGFWREKVELAQAATVTGEVVDEATGQPIPARIYVQRADGKNYFPDIAPRQPASRDTNSASLAPVPDKLVVLTFDDSVASHHTVVRPLLKKLGFGATFFITEGFSFRTNKQDYLTWEQIAELHRDGFEIGNHTRDHLGVSAHTLGLLRQQVEAINQRCAEHRIPRPVSFAYPGNAIHPGALPLLKELGFKFARRGGEPEIPYKLGGGVAYEPGLDHPLLIPTAGDARPAWTLEDAKRAASLTGAGRIAVFQFHGVPDREHPWVNTPPEKFVDYMEWLHANGYRAIALRDVARHVDPERVPADPWAIIHQRQARLARGESPVAPSPPRPPASSLRYEKRNWINTNSAEFHTTLSADPFRLELPPGQYTFTIERGKEWRPVSRQVTVGQEPLALRFPLPRWVNMAARGWFSGDTHVHRRLDELANVLLAEDLNVAFPLTYWVTKAFAPPTQGDKSSREEIPAGLIRVDDTHVAWPRNTEWEIFTVNGKNHTLGAVFALGHKTPFTNGAPTVLPIAEAARREGALLDLDKHDWPWSLAIVPLMNVDLFELSNNHVWRTHFAFTNWSAPAPDYMRLPNGGRFETERDWLDYTHQTYWTLLNCGFRLRPTAGSASGVHPVPLGFGRVYVHQPQGFTYEGWLKGLNEGRSFVTTGPMLLAEVRTNEVTATILSDEPVSALEVIVNGELRHRVAVTPTRNAEGAWEATARQPLQLDGTSWVALRCWEPRPAGRERFAHTAPRWFDVASRPLLPRRAEADFLVRRVREQIERSRGVIPAAAIAEYEQALAVYERIAATAR